MTGAGTLPASWGPRVPFKKSSTALVMVGMHGQVGGGGGGGNPPGNRVLTNEHHHARPGITTMPPTQTTPLAYAEQADAAMLFAV